MPPDRVCVAQIGAPHGVHGAVRMRVFAEDPAALERFGPLETEDASRHFEVEALSAGRGYFVAKLHGVDDRTSAQQLTNLRLYVPRVRLPPIEEPDTFYHADLIGLLAVDRKGEELGTVLTVQNFGAGDLLEIQPAAGGSAVLLPFTARAVPIVDMPGGRIVVDPPLGTFEESGAEQQDSSAE